jgi:hypothetical protein
MTARPEPAQTAESVCAYKRVLQRVLDNRPSGTRQRLAAALGKNRSFVSQIANPNYPTPIPAQHIETIFDVCHFSQEDRRAFLTDYTRAHRQRLKLVAGAKRMRSIAVAVPDLGDTRRNKAIDDLVAEFARKLGRVIDELE